MLQLIVKSKKLNKRKVLPSFLPDPNGVVGVVNQSFTFIGEEVMNVPNPGLGKWYKDRDENFYWGGGLNILDEQVDENAPEFSAADNVLLESISITPLLKRKIQQVINAFETGKADGDYASLVRLRDYNDPETKIPIVQVTFGRSQTTEFGHLRSLVESYIESKGRFAEQLKPFVGKIGRKPSLATDADFCNTLIRAGKEDPIMKTCQDIFFDAKYYQPALGWFTENGFRLPLSLLIVYDSKVHSGGILSFLRKKISTTVPVMGGNEQEWITNYVQVRHNWLANHSNHLLRNTIYRTECFKELIQNKNWDLSQSVNAHGVLIS